jgi:glucokinase
MSEPMLVGIDLGGTSVKVALVDYGGRVAAKQSAPFDVEAEPARIVDQIGSLIEALLARTLTVRDRVGGVGVGAPGPLSPRAGRIIRCANLPRWIDVPLRDLLGARLNKPVVLDNDGNAAAFGEFWAGAGRGGGDLVMLTLGTGVGAGVILSGRILHGHFENAAELGHMIVEANGVPCACGQRGCLEAYASASAVARRARAAIDEGGRSELSGKVRQGSGLTSEDVFQAASRGDELCCRIWDESCRYLAIGCINIQHAFNPERIVLGGGSSAGYGTELEASR